MSYLYANHMGGFFIDEDILDFKDLYCEECGDSDMYLGKVDNYSECRDTIFSYLTCSPILNETQIKELSKEGRREYTSMMEAASLEAQNFFSKNKNKNKRKEIKPWEKLQVPELGFINYNVEQNEKGMNKSINFHVLPEQEMRNLGFTDYREGYWYLSRPIDDDWEVTFNITIAKDGHEGNIDVLDDDFCQPYDYQRILKNNKNQFAYYTFLKVEEYMQELIEAGVISGHNYGDYI